MEVMNLKTNDEHDFNFANIRDTRIILPDREPILEFFYEGESLGKLTQTDGVFSFSGNCEKSAKMFFNYIIESLKSNEQTEKEDGNIDD